MLFLLIYTKSKITKLGQNRSKLWKLPYAKLFDPFLCQKMIKKLDFQFCLLFNTFIKDAKNHSQKFQKPKSDLYVQKPLKYLMWNPNSLKKKVLRTNLKLWKNWKKIMKTSFVILGHFDNRKKVSWYQLILYIKWWTFVMIMMTRFLMFDTFECHFKPLRLCKIGMRHPVDEKFVIALKVTSQLIQPCLANLAVLLCL